jgi:hypothetical protein
VISCKKSQVRPLHLSCPELISDSSLAVFSPGSSHPASVLYDALEHFDAKSPKADEAFRSIRPDLANAVDTCIEAAGREIDTYWQKRLLKVSSASYRLVKGKGQEEELITGCSVRTGLHGPI